MFLAETVVYQNLRSVSLPTGSTCNVFVSLARYVWENLEVGYIQGMCDLVAPLLVIFDDGEFELNWMEVYSEHCQQ